MNENMKINWRVLKMVIPGAVPAAMFVKYYHEIMELPSNLFSVISILVLIVIILLQSKLISQNKEVIEHQKKQDEKRKMLERRNQHE